MNDQQADLEMMEEIARVIASMLIEQFEQKVAAMPDDALDGLPSIPDFAIRVDGICEDSSKEVAAQLQELIRREIEEYYQPVLLH